MALSERDQEVLSQIERGLDEADPRWSSRMSPKPPRPSHLYLAGTMFLLGIAMLVAGAMLAQGLLFLGVLVSVGGFGLMFGATWELCFGRSGLAGVARSRRANESRSTTKQ